MDGVQILGLCMVFLGLGLVVGSILGRLAERERMEHLGKRRLRSDTTIHHSIGGYEAGPRLVSDLPIPKVRP